MKYLFTFVLTLLITFVCINAPAQDTAVTYRHNSISLCPGYSQTRDLNLHPKTFRGLSVGVSFGHEALRKHLISYRTALTIEALHTSYEDFPGAAVINLNGNFSYLFPLTSQGGIDFYAGPSMALQYGTSAYFNWDESHFYYANFIHAGLTAAAFKQLAKSTLVFHLEVPVAAVICRPELYRLYKMDDMTFPGIIATLSDNPRFAFPDRNFSINTGLELRYSNGSHRRAAGVTFLYHHMQAKEGNAYRHTGFALTYKIILRQHTDK